ncbi:BTAD domain-containing putative transcriptional regulator [Streptomyces sp. NPDC003717]|uniref:AfsR/SARP family transcriptional regulator n=1 Tax=Streptomyces sp. NPDC003717 TaxID=3154276 RepID=UPI0033B238F2
MATPEGVSAATAPGPAPSFRILGPLECWSGARRLELGGPISRRVLAVLLLEPGRLLTVPRLVDAAWPDDPPATAAHQIRKAISELRRRIPGGAGVLVTDGPGYAIVRDAELDATRFADLVRQGGEAARRGAREEAAGLLGEALALRRGPILAGITDGVVGSVARTMEERYLSVVEDYFDLRLACGQGAGLVGELREHSGRHPLREKLCGQLMRALSGAGRRAEALTEYERLRRALVEELGVDPDPQLAALHGRILAERADPGRLPPDDPDHAAGHGARPRARPEAPPGRAGGAGTGGGAAGAAVPEAGAPGIAVAHAAVGGDAILGAGVPGAIAPGVTPPALPVLEVTVPEAQVLEVTTTEVPAPAAVPAPSPVPRTLPLDLADFVGRTKELDRLLDAARPDGTGSRVIAIDGMGGTGKTCLAVHAAHLLAAAYPDGQLYLNLRGFSQDEQPVTLNAALELLLRSFGVPPDRVPDNVVDKELLWRSVLAGRRVLLLLDNIGVDTTMVERLLPTAPGCLVLVTSRARLVELDGADWLSLDVLEPRESLQLVARLLGPERVAAEEEASRELTRLCDHMPLALRIATARLRNRRMWTLGYLVERLRDENHKLSELNSGRRGVAPTLRLSYQVLSEECRRAFRALAFHPGPEFDVHSAAAVLGQDDRSTEEQLEHLLDAHLLQQSEAGRYIYHDLVRSYARGLCQDPAAEEEQAVSSQRLLDYYLAATEAACDVLYPGRSRRPTGLELPTLRQGALVRPESARAWFAKEHTALANVIASANSGGRWRHAVCLSRNFAFYLNSVGALEEFAEFTRIAAHCARELGDAPLLSVSLANLGVACWKLGRFAEGIEAATEGMNLALQIEDWHTEAHTRGTLGLCESLRGRFPQALDHLLRAEALERRLESPRALADTLSALSTLYEQWGRYGEAAEAAQSAVVLLGGLGRHESALSIRTDLALARIGLRDLDGARESLAEARGLCEERNEPGLMALALALSAEAGYCAGRPEAAEEADRLTERARQEVERSRSPLRQAKARNVLGRLLHGRGLHAEAMRQHTAAHRAAVAVGFRAEEAYACAGMAVAADALGEAAAAAAHRAAAEEVFAELGVPAELRRRAPEPVSWSPGP